MRLVSYGPRGYEQPGVLADGRIVPLTPLLERLGVAASGMPAVLGLLELLRPDIEREIATAPEGVDPASTRLGPPVPRPATIVGVGRNYPTGAGAGGPPPAPVFFAKPGTALIGPHDAIVRPAQTEMLDYEGELAIVIGRGGRDIAAADAGGHIAGYTLANDVTAPDLMFPGSTSAPGEMSPLLLQPLLGKGHDTFLPLGPCVVTADELPDVEGLELRLSVNGEPRQRARVGDMLHGAAELVALTSAFLTLHPGDIILTGTPPGIGWMMDPPRFLSEGDVIVLEIDEIGAIRSEIRDAPRR